MTTKFNFTFRWYFKKQKHNCLNFIQSRNFANVSPKQKSCQRKPIISCKRPEYNFYGVEATDKFEKITLASTGWTHNRSKGDYFTIHPQLSGMQETVIPFHDITASALAEYLKKEDIHDATEFQQQAITSVKSGKHCFLAAETGCGKTFTYILPILENLINNKTSNLNSPKALILAPNRELAFQIGFVAERLGESVGVNVKTIVGGRTKKFMMNPEFSEIDVLVGTPGAIGKLSTVGIFKLNEVRCTVIDEADTLLDESFEDRMESLLRRVSQSQLVLVSATLPKRLPAFLEPVEANLIYVKSPKLHMPLLNVTQHFVRLAKSSKPFELLQFVKRSKHPMLIFTNRNPTCNWLAMFLRENSLPCSNINGEMNYAIRIDQWNQFVQGETKILSATDVGSRGLDTTQVSHVLNYDFPLYASDYIHRVGRTGRFGSPENCKITNFVAGLREIKLVQQIEMAVRTSQPIPNVDGNITNIVKNKIMRKTRDVI